MAHDLHLFETIARNAHRFTDAAIRTENGVHPFDARNIHPDVGEVSRHLFDDGHYPQATLEAFKFVEKKVQELAASREFGRKLMMNAFNELNPAVRLTASRESNERGEQEGYKFLFAGATLAIRNPRAHEICIRDDPDLCLDHLSLASMLLRRLETTRCA